jgi:hypothetical protein
MRAGRRAKVGFLNVEFSISDFQFRISFRYSLLDIRFDIEYRTGLRAAGVEF